MQRLFVQAALSPGEAVTASEGQAHYLAHVLRLAPGDAVVLFNGRDGEWLARIGDLHRKRTQLLPETRIRSQAPCPDLWLVFAPLKRDATDLVVRQATELGVSVLAPVISARASTAHIRAERWEAIAREAAEQCERLDLPAIRPPVKFFDLLGGWPAERRLAAAIERGPASVVPTQAGALLVGPEGGFAPLELDALRAARFVVPLCLGPRVLRAETACVAGLSLLQAERWSTS